MSSSLFWEPQGLFPVAKLDNGEGGGQHFGGFIWKQKGDFFRKTEVRFCKKKSLEKIIWGNWDKGNNFTKVSICKHLSVLSD